MHAELFCNAFRAIQQFLNHSQQTKQNTVSNYKNKKLNPSKHGTDSGVLVAQVFCLTAKCGATE